MNKILKCMYDLFKKTIRGINNFKIVYCRYMYYVYTLYTH